MYPIISTFFLLLSNVFPSLSKILNFFIIEFNKNSKWSVNKNPRTKKQATSYL